MFNLLIINVLFLFNVQAQTMEGNLETDILQMDSLLFEVAFNQCDLTLYQQIMSEEFEFYDDRTGLNTSREKDIASFQDKCAKPFSVTRKLIDTDIHRLGDFGAVQNGTHIFLVDGKVVETAKFTTIWEATEDGWMVKRAISYAHKPVK